MRVVILSISFFFFLNKKLIFYFRFHGEKVGLSLHSPRKELIFLLEGCCSLQKFIISPVNIYLPLSLFSFPSAFIFSKGKNQWVSFVHKFSFRGNPIVENFIFIKDFTMSRIRSNVFAKEDNHVPS